MSKDASYTYLHTHSSRLADLFEDFCHPPSSTGPSSSSTNPTNSTTANPPTTSSSNHSTNGQPSHIPGHFLPFEEIHLPPHLMPVNPEDEDDVVPDMHAAFGINAALGQQERNAAGGVGGGGGGRGAGGEEAVGGQTTREPVWRDFGLERLVDGGPIGGVTGGRGGVGGGGGGVVGGRREGKRSAVLLLR